MGRVDINCSLLVLISTKKRRTSIKRLMVENDQEKKPFICPKQITDDLLIEVCRFLVENEAVSDLT